MLAEILLVEETASLAGSLGALLEADGFSVRRFPAIGDAEAFHAAEPRPHPVVVVASNAHFCPSAGRWPLGPLREAALLVVGTRDPALRSSGRLHVVRLPLEPEELLRLVRGLLTGEAAGDRPA
jgi:hypothetical protein